jgi:hypothetical protein
MRQRFLTVFSMAIATAVLGSAVSSHAAAPLATPIMPSGIGGVDSFLCQALNVSLKSLEVTVEIVNTADGSVIAMNAATLAPSGSLNVISISSANQFCRATGLTAKTGKLTFTAVDVNIPVMYLTAP